MVSKRENKDSGLESNVSVFADIATVESLDTLLKEMNAISLNFWLCKFFREVPILVILFSRIVMLLLT